MISLLGKRLSIQSSDCIGRKEPYWFDEITNAWHTVAFNVDDDTLKWERFKFDINRMIRRLER